MAPAAALAPQQLDNLVGPIALYPDPLLAQVLAASTYPVELVEAQQWLLANQNLNGQPLMDAARQQNWDPSVQALVAMPNVLAQTHAGFAWSVAFGGAVVLAIVALLKPDGTFAHALLWLAVIVIAAGKASLGHAADVGALSAAVGVQTVHLLATAVWGGVVLAGGLAVLPVLGSSVARGALIRIGQQMSRTSVIAVVFVLGTGVLNAVRGLGGSFAPLDGSTWGRVLLLKLLLVALALVLGGLNRFSALPRLRRTASTEDAHTFRNILHLEALTMIGVFVAAAVLSFSVPGFAALG